MPSKFTVPYQIVISPPARYHYVARVPVSVKTNSGYKEYIFLLDTGASFTTVPKFMAQEVGYKPRRQDQDKMTVASGAEMTVYHGSIGVRIGPFEEKIRCVFSSHNETPFLLGRVDILDRFNFELNAKKKQLTISRIS